MALHMCFQVNQAVVLIGDAISKFWMAWCKRAAFAFRSEGGIRGIFEALWKLISSKSLWSFASGGHC